MEIDFEEMLMKMKKLSKNDIDWHHHYLPPNCLLSKQNKHVITLEAEEQQWVSSFDYKPMEELEEMENIFFRR